MQSNMKLVVLESPYAGDVEENIRYARECIKDSLNRGEAPIASHLLYTQPGILDDNKPYERNKGIQAGLVWARHAELAVFYVDKGMSEGMRNAVSFYMLNEIPCELRTLYPSFANVVNKKDDTIVIKHLY